MTAECCHEFRFSVHKYSTTFHFSVHDVESHHLCNITNTWYLCVVYLEVFKFFFSCLWILVQFYLFICGAEYRTQGLLHARQALLPLSHNSSYYLEVFNFKTIHILGQINFYCGILLCIVGFLAASLIFTLKVLEASTLQAMITKSISRCYQALREKITTMKIKD